MSDDWQVGDVAVCVDATAVPGCPFASPLREGASYTVSAVELDLDDDGDIGLQLAGVSLPEGVSKNGIYWLPRFKAWRFRKVRHDLREVCEAEFVTLLRRIKRKVAA